MGQTYGKLTGHSTTYTLLLLTVVAKYTALAARRTTTFNPRLQYTILNGWHKLFSRNNLLSHLLADATGLAIAWRLLVWATNVADFFRLDNKQKYDHLGGALVNFFSNTPPLSWTLKKEKLKMEQGLRLSLKNSPHVTAMVRALPQEGRSAEALLAEVQAMVQVEDVKWKSGKVSGAVYHGGAAHLECQNQIAALYSLSNPLHPDVWPSLRKFEAEIISMTCDFMNGGDENVVGCMTSGGTESILMAVKAHRALGYREYGIDFPEMIIPVTAHAAFDKAAEAFCIKLIKLPVDPVTFQINPAHVEARMNGNTILIVGSGTFVVVFFTWFAWFCLVLLGLLGVGRCVRWCSTTNTALFSCFWGGSLILSCAYFPCFSVCVCFLVLVSVV